MPGSTAAAVVALLIAPGFLMVRGYSRRRARNVPDRDVYAVAEAVVASAIWLAVVWLLLFVGWGEDTTKTWGLIPYNAEHLEEHRSAVVAAGLGVIVAPYLVGSFAAEIANEIARPRWPHLLKRLRHYGLFRMPTAWDRAWAQIQGLGAAHIVVQLKDGSLVAGGYGTGGQADLTPLPHQVLLPKAHGHATADFAGGVDDLLNPDQNRATLLQQAGFYPITEPTAVLIEGSEIAAVYFRRAA